MRTGFRNRTLFFLCVCVCVCVVIRVVCSISSLYTVTSLCSLKYWGGRGMCHRHRHFYLCDMGWENAWPFPWRLLVWWTSGRESSTGPLAELEVKDHWTRMDLKPWHVFTYVKKKKNVCKISTSSEWTSEIKKMHNKYKQKPTPNNRDNRVHQKQLLEHLH